jgi:hypothetical protein
MTVKLVASVVFAQVIAFAFGTMVGYDKCRQDVLKGIQLFVPDKLAKMYVEPTKDHQTVHVTVQEQAQVQDHDQTQAHLH